MFRIILLLACCASAQNLCTLIGTEIYAQDRDNTFLGMVSDNPYASTSIMNKYGTYGSKYSSTSIFNTYGTFGSNYSSYSPYNAYTSTPPVLVEDGEAVAYLSKNRFLGGTTVDPDALIGALAAGCGGIYNPPIRTKPDLVVDSLIAVLSKNKDSLYFGYIVANIGAVTSPAFTVGIAVNGNAIAPISFPAIAPGYYEYDIRGYKLDKDTTSILIGADYLQQITEESENNNIATGNYLTPKPTAIHRVVKPSVMPYKDLSRFNILGRTIR